MKKLFYIGILLLIAFEILHVYFIMPFPGSQQMDSVGLAYFLHSYRWFFRILAGILILTGAKSVFSGKREWIPTLALLVTFGVVYMFNFKMSADAMFKESEHLTLQPKATNILDSNTIIIGVSLNGEAKAYPIRYLAYHHQVQDSLGGKPILVTYCSVCRTGRVFEPIVDGKHETFRLVGMDHFNAMFEDATTKSWWRQANGQAITGKLKGKALPEIASVQMALGKWFSLFPNGKVMQPDITYSMQYDTLGRYEQGKSKGELTRTDSASWQNKSWVVGIQLGNAAKAYDWNILKQKNIIQDKVGSTPILLVLSEDKNSFTAFERTAADSFYVQHDTLVSNTGKKYNLSGQPLQPGAAALKAITAYQEFWHSWRTFHPETTKYE